MVFGCRPTDAANFAEHMRIHASGNVGIGTTSPSAKLHVKSSGNGAYILRGMSSAGTDLGGLYQSTAGDGEIYLKTSAVTTNVRISSNNVSYLNGGNVGIGTTSPSATLTVIGNQLFDGTGINLKRTGVLSGRTWNFGVDSNGLSVYDINSSSYRLTIDETGNVGIGTTSPARELHVKGNNGWGEVRIEGQTFASGHGASLEFYSEGTALADIYASTDKHLYFRTNGGTERMRITSGGAVLVNKTSSTGDIFQVQGSNNVYASRFDGSTTVGQSYGLRVRAGTNASDKSFLIENTSGTDLMVVNGDGNVGIGTGSPSYELHVQGSNNGNINTTVENTNTGTNAYATYRLKNNSINTAALFLNGSNNTGYSGANSLNMYQGGNHPLGFVTSNQTRMTVTGGGNVGIGTTSPLQKLDVDGNIQILDTNASDGDIFGYLNFHSTNGGSSGNHARIAARRDSAAAGQMLFYTKTGGAASEKMRITSAGNVGIGTDSPSEKLHVLGNIKSNHVYAETYRSSRTDGDVYIQAASSSDFVSIGTEGGNNNLLTVLGSGNVGIGTTSPGQKLDVSGNIAVRNTNKIFFNHNTDTSRYIGASSTNDLDIASNDDLNLRSNYNRFWNGSTEFARLSGSANSWIANGSNGKLGIGTTSPAYKLDVAGTSRSDLHIFRSNQSAPTADAFIFRPADNTVALGTANAERVRIDSSGNVGIGTTNPTEKLAVDGNIETTQPVGKIGFNVGDAYGDFPHYGLGKSNGANPVNLSGYYGLTFGSNGTERMRITSDGNVGIGTTNPYSNLWVSGLGINAASELTTTDTTSNAILALAGTNSLVRLQMGTMDVSPWGGWIQASYDNTSEGGTNGVAPLLLNPLGGSAGNVGIGTTSPNEKLTVAGNIHAYAPSGINAGLFASTAAGATSIAIRSSGVTFFNAGNVGIGTTSPSQKLEVNGNIKIGDAQKSLYGTGDDLQIYHDGSNSYISDTGTGDLYLLASDNVYFQTHGSGKRWITLNENASVDLFYNDSKKLETTSTGVAVTGKITNLTAGTGNLDAVNVQQLNNATTGALIYKGTWSAAPTTTSVLDGAVSSAGTIVIDAPNPGISVGATITGTGISGTVTVSNIAADGITIAISSPQTIANGTTLTFTTVGGTPDLSQASRKVTGHYYICETAGAVTPNGAGTTPNEWAVGDWVTFSDLTTDAWQKIDNSSVLSGAGTGGKVPVWSGSGTSVTLADAPITVSGSNATFAGDVLVEDNLYLTDAGTVRGKIQLNSSDRDNLDIKATSLGSLMRFYTVDTLALTLDSSQNATFAGDVTLSSTGPLLYLANTTSTTGKTWRFSSAANGKFFITQEGVVDAVTLDHTTGNASFAGSIYANTIYSATNSAYYIDVNSTGVGLNTAGGATLAGNVGIGTTDPKSKLHVNGGIQMAGDTAAASADKVGTMRYRTGTEYVEVNGTELVTNGDFSGGSQDWTKEAGWSIASGKASYDASSATNALYQNIGLTTGSVYKLSFTVVDYTSGSFKAHLSNGNVSAATDAISANGNYSFNITATGALVLFRNVTSFNGSIDNVSVIEVTAEDASYADMCMQTGASTYEWVNIVRNTY